MNVLGFSFKSPKFIANSIYNVYFNLSIILALLSIVFIKPLHFGLLSFTVNLTIGLWFKIKSVRELPGLPLLGFYFFLFLQTPIFYILVLGSDFDFESNYVLPKENFSYYKNIFSGIFFNFLFHVFLILGLLFGNKLHVKPLFKSRQHFTKSKTFYFLIFLAILVLFSVLSNVLSISSARAEGIAKKENIIPFIFNDQTFPILLGILFYGFNFLSYKKKIIIYLLIIGSFFALGSITSKASIYLMFIYFFLIPVSVYYNSETLIIWPKRKLIFLGIIISPILFFITWFFKIVSLPSYSIYNGLTFDIFNILTALKDFEFSNLFILIFNRFSISVGNSIAIFSEFFNFSHFEYRMDYAKYMSKGFINLILPGTPYLEAYTPSSMYLYDVLSFEKIESTLTKVTLLKQANTQPFTLFGTLTIIFGPLSVLVSFLFGMFFSVVYKLTNAKYIKGLLIFLLFAFLQVYGLEQQIYYCIYILATGIIIFQIINLFDKIKFKINNEKKY